MHYHNLEILIFAADLEANSEHSITGETKISEANLLNKTQASKDGVGRGYNRLLPGLQSVHGQSQSTRPPQQRWIYLP